jgi:hypothetical protein
MNGCKKAGLAILHCGHTREYVMGLFWKTHGRMTMKIRVEREENHTDGDVRAALGGRTNYCNIYGVETKK